MPVPHDHPAHHNMVQDEYAHPAQEYPKYVEPDRRSRGENTVDRIANLRLSADTLETQLGRLEKTVFLLTDRLDIVLQPASDACLPSQFWGPDETRSVLENQVTAYAGTVSSVCDRLDEVIRRLSL